MSQSWCSFFTYKMRNLNCKQSRYHRRYHLIRYHYKKFELLLLIGKKRTTLGITCKGGKGRVSHVIHCWHEQLKKKKKEQSEKNRKVENISLGSHRPHRGAAKQRLLSCSHMTFKGGLRDHQMTTHVLDGCIGHWIENCQDGWVQKMMVYGVKPS